MRYRIAAGIVLALAVAALTLRVARPPVAVQGQSPAPSANPVAQPTAEQERFRADLATYLSDLKGMVSAAQQLPGARAALSQAGVDSRAALTAAQEQVRQLTAAELDALQAAFAQNPNWKQQPRQLTAAIGAGMGEVRGFVN